MKCGMSVILLLSWISTADVSLAEDAIDLSSPFKVFGSARRAVERRDGKQLDRCCTQWCIDSLIADSALACMALEKELQTRDPVRLAAFEKQRRAVIETTFERILLDELGEDDWSIWRRQGFHMKDIRKDIGLIGLYEYLEAENMRLVRSGAGYSVENGLEEIECVIEKVVDEYGDQLERAMIDYENGYVLAKLTGIADSRVVRAKRKLAECYGGATALFRFYDLLASTGAELEPFVALQGGLKELTTEGSHHATGRVIVRRAGQIHSWKFEFKREGKDWRIDSLGYGYELEPVFNSDFPKRPEGRWEWRIKESESKE